MKFLKAFFALSIYVISCFSANAQIGGHGIYKFMNLPLSSRLASLGGNQIAVKDDDISLGMQNPALLNPMMHNHVQFSYIDYMSDVNFGSIGYARHFDSLGTFQAGMQYINYGDFVLADERGNKVGSFSGGDYNFFVGLGREWKRFSYGANLKFIYSGLESYKSYGAAIDLGGAYQDTARGYTFGLVMKNIGYQLKPYFETREPMPFEIQFGASVKPKHMPVRFNFLFHDLQKWDLTYKDPSKTPEPDLGTGLIKEDKIPFSEKIGRHVNVGAELLISKNFHIRFGYNHQRRKEMIVPDAKGTVGYSYGFGFRVSKFNISYGRAAYHIGGASNTFTITSNLSKFFNSKQPASL
ncbi:MAG: type IX secretion system protein PorQ [Sphingobacteriales bacterium]|nr:MAG: type IX secretion system protein PorQ [Sphingobacteriales bacterium]